MQAINDWQRGHSSAHQRQRRARTLKAEAAKLDKRYRQCGLVCFRQIALEKGKSSLWELMAEDRLPELISSWTLDLDFAMKFKGGVPPEEWQGIIFSTTPKPHQVVVNLSTLYADRDFQGTVKLLKPQITGFYDGIGKYKGSQSEVVLEIDHVTTDDVYTMGGYSSDKARLAHLLSVTRRHLPNRRGWISILLEARRSRVARGGSRLQAGATSTNASSLKSMRSRPDSVSSLSRSVVQFPPVNGGKITTQLEQLPKIVPDGDCMSSARKL